MSEQLALVGVAVADGLTDRQRFALQFVKDGGEEGVSADEVGAAWCAQRGKHGVTTRCGWDASNGNQVLRALCAKGLVRYRRRTVRRDGAWVAVGADTRPVVVSYNEFPDGF